MDILFKKILANTIDLFASLIVRLLVISIIISLFRESILISIEDFMASNEGIKDQKEIAILFLKHDVFKILLSLISIFIVSGSIYNIYFYSSTWCATIGQRLMSIVTVREDGQYINLSRSIIYYITSVIPFIITLYFLLFLVANGGLYLNNGLSGILNIFGANIVNIIMSIMMLLWVNLPFFINNKKSMADIICKTKVEIGKTESRFPKIRI
ncbi:RDD family protein [Rickettsiales bacterium]|nr:RDD family protein [Rickettsiales bacterium]MDB2550338.1 RDD family protein [Rickettsiales bacterium]